MSMNIYMQQNQQRNAAKQTNLMSKSRQNYQSGSYSRISNRYDSIEDSLTDDDPADNQAKPQQISEAPVIHTMLQQKLNCDSMGSGSNFGTMSWQASPPSHIFLNQAISKGNSPAINFRDMKTVDLNNCYFSHQIAPGISTTLSQNQFNMCDEIIGGTGSFENNSLSEKRDSLLASQNIRRQIVELDDPINFFKNGNSGQKDGAAQANDTHDDDGENVSDDDEPQRAKVLQEIPAILNMDASVLNQRRDSNIYSFSKNIDYSQITDQQKRRFLREKKSYKNNMKKIQQIVPNSSSVKSSMTIEEKENQVCSEFTAQNVKFVANNYQHPLRNKAMSYDAPTEYVPKYSNSKPKSILKASNNGGTKTCIQNNVYQSAQFISKPKQYNNGKKQVARVVPQQINHHANIEILDQKQAQIVQKYKTKLSEVSDQLRKGSNVESERSASKNSRRSNVTSKFQYPVQNKTNSKTRFENKRPSQIKRKTSPNGIPSDVQSGSYISGKRGSAISTQENQIPATTQKTPNYDVKAHRNILEQFGKKESITTVNSRKASGQRKASARYNTSSQSIKSPREINRLATNKQFPESDKQMSSNKLLASTVKPYQQKQNMLQKKQKNLELNVQIQEKNDGMTLKMKATSSGNLSHREQNTEKSKSKGKLNMHQATNTMLIQSSQFEQNVLQQKNFNKSGDHQSKNSISTQGSLKIARGSIPASIHTTIQPKMQIRQSQQTQKVKSVIQIDLVDKKSNIRQRQRSKNKSRDSTVQGTPPVDPNNLRLKDKVLSIESSSAIDEQLTARGSAAENKEDRKQIMEGSAVKVEDHQQEKYKIWMMPSVIDEQQNDSPSLNKKDRFDESISDPFKLPVTDSKFTLTVSEDQLNQKTIVDPIDQSLQKSDLALTTETNDMKLQVIDSLSHHPKKILQVDTSNQKNYNGPQRASKLHRRSKKMSTGYETKEGQVSVNDIPFEDNTKLIGQNSTCLMENDEFEELQLQQSKIAKKSQNEEESNSRAIQQAQEGQKQQNMNDEANNYVTLNQTVKETTIRQDLLLEGKSAGPHEQSLSEITQFNQRDFMSSNLDETNHQHGQSRNISQTMPSAQRNQTHSTIHRTQGSPDNRAQSHQIAATATIKLGGGTITDMTPLQDEHIVMKNERCSDLLMNVDAAQFESKKEIQNAEQFLAETGFGGQYYNCNIEKSNLAAQVQSPQFGGLSNKVDIRQSLPNSARQSIPNSMPQSSSCLDSTKTIDEDVYGQNSQPNISQYNPGQTHPTNCKCNDCSSKMDQIQQKIDQIPFEIYGAPTTNRSNSTHQINFDALLEQHLILQQIRDLIEIRPSTVQNYCNQKSSFISSNGGANSQSMLDSIPITQAIEGLTVDERIKIQTLCQEWWDSTQEDTSVFKMALAYQQDTQEAYFRSSLQDQILTIDERNVLNNQNYERSQCMRKQVVLSSVVIGMTAFFSMLTRQGKKDSTIISNDSTIKQDLELRTRLSQLIKILYDQQMLCLSYGLGKLAKYDKVTKNRNSAEFKLHTIYNEYIHLLFINKKIQTEDDYQIFNNRGLLSQYPPEQYINNEENRDFQLGQLSRRLQDNCFRIIDSELIIQQNSSNSGNSDLLHILKDIVEHSADIDFQEGKNHIFEGISNSEALQSTNNVSQIELTGQDEAEDEGELIQLGGETLKQNEEEEKENAVQEMRAACQETVGLGGHLLVKTFKDDVNQIIQEESREESMSVSVSMINSSKIPPDADGVFSHSVSNERSRMQLQGRTPKNVHLESALSQETQLNEMQQDFERMNEIQEHGATDKSKKFEEGTFDSVERSKTLKLDDTDLRVHEPLGTCSFHNLSNDQLLLNNDSLKRLIEVPTYMRVSQMTNNSIENSKQKNPFLPPIRSEKKYTLILDLEETLIYSTVFSKRVSKASNYQKVGDEELLVYQRPGLTAFLKEMSELYELVIFSQRGEAITKTLVNKMIGAEYIDHILSAEHLTNLSSQDVAKIKNKIDDHYKCYQICSSRFGSSSLEPYDQSYDQLNTSEGGPTTQLASPNQPSVIQNISSNDLNLNQEKANQIKDLSKLGRDLSKVIIVDDRADNFGWHLKNGICISEFIFDGMRKAKQDNDQCLKQLGQMLKTIHDEAQHEKNPDQVDLRIILGEHLQKRRDLKQNKFFY